MQYVIHNLFQLVTKESGIQTGTSRIMMIIQTSEKNKK